MKTLHFCCLHSVNATILLREQQEDIKTILESGWVVS